MQTDSPDPEGTFEIIHLNPASDPAYLVPAIGFIELDMPDEAWEELEKLPPERMRDEQVFDMRLQIFEMRGDWQGGLEFSSALAAEFPLNYAWPTYMAYFLRELGRPQAAYELFVEEAQKHPDAYPPHHTLAVYACIVGEIEMARTALKRAIAIWPDLRRNILDDPELMPVWDLADTGFSEGES